MQRDKQLKPLIEREKIPVWDRWWLPAVAGGMTLIVAFVTATQGEPPEPWQMALFTFGILVGLLDGIGSWQIVSYGTLQGPEERENEAMARLFVWERARWRYALGFLVSMTTWMLLARTRSEDTLVAAIFAPMIVYCGLWGFDLFRSLREAKRLFPPEAA